MLRKSNFPMHLKIAAIPEYYSIPKWQENNFADFTCAYVMHFIQQALGFSYDIFTPDDNSFGSDTPSGNWTGMIGMVQRGQADIATGTVISASRLKVVDFSFPYMYTDITFATDKPEYVPKRFAIFYTFSLVSWVSVLLSLLSISFLLYVLIRRKYSYISVLFASFGILLENTLGIKMRTRSEKICCFSWIIGAMFLSTCYKAVLLAFITFPSMTGIYDIKDLSNASKTPSFRCRAFPGSVLSNMLLNSSDELFQPIGKCIKRNSWDMKPTQEFLDEPNVKKALLDPRLGLVQFEHTHFLSEDSFFQSYIGLAVGKTFCCKKTIDKIILRLFDVGLLQKWQKDYSFFSSFSRASSFSPKSGNSYETLSLDDLFGAFAVFIIGLTCATAVFCMEICIHKLKNKKQH